MPRARRRFPRTETFDGARKGNGDWGRLDPAFSNPRNYANVCDTTPESVAASLTVPERMLLFCLVSRTDWVKAGVTQTTIRHGTC